jgi:hypothetical protein
MDIRRSHDSLQAVRADSSTVSVNGCITSHAYAYCTAAAVFRRSNMTSNSAPRPLQEKLYARTHFTDDFVHVKMGEVNLKEIQATLIELAFEAGRMILSANIHDISLDTKLNCEALPPSIDPGATI